MLTNKKILNFWFPLSATWMMMAVEGPFLTALIARLPEPVYNLAAYGVAFAIALVLESPVINMMSASTALAKDSESYIRLRTFIILISLAVTFLLTVVVIPPIFDFLTIDLIKLPERVSHLTHLGVVLLIPWPGAIGIRRFYHGVLIRNNQTRKVAYGTAIRMISMATAALFFYNIVNVRGIILGAASLTVAVCSEAIATRFMAKKVINKVLATPAVETPMTQKEITKFYTPLALTAFISLGVHPIVTFFIGQSRMAVESLAVLPVLNGLVFIFRSFGLSYQEAAIALLESRDDYIKLRNFAIGMAVATVSTLGIVSLTPIADLWLITVAGLSDSLAHFSRLPLILYTIFPATTVAISFQRALLVATKNTNPVSMASILEVTGITTVMLGLIYYADFVGVSAAIIAYTVGRTIAMLYLSKSSKQAANKYL
jgi:hypothetical protein